MIMYGCTVQCKASIIFTVQVHVGAHATCDYGGVEGGCCENYEMRLSPSNNPPTFRHNLLTADTNQGNESLTGVVLRPHHAFAYLSYLVRKGQVKKSGEIRMNVRPNQTLHCHEFIKAISRPRNVTLFRNPISSVSGLNTTY